MENTITVIQAIKQLSCVCDGARTLDGKGFAACDTNLNEFGAYDMLTELQELEFLPILKKYSKTQLHAEVVLSEKYQDNATILEHQTGRYKHTIKKSVTFENGSAVLSFKYETDLISEVKSLPNRSYNPGEKNWTVELSTELQNLLDDWGFNYDKIYF